MAFLIFETIKNRMKEINIEFFKEIILKFSQLFSNFNIENRYDKDLRP